MFRYARRAVALAAFVLAALGGISIASMPDHEVLYATRPPITTCISSGCLLIYTLEVGNTGRDMQQRIEVRLRQEVVDRAILPLTVRAFGKVPLNAAVKETDGIRSYTLAYVKPGDRVEFSFTLREKSRDAATSWNQILVGVDPSQGTSIAGDPAVIALGRMLYLFFGW